MKAAGGREEEEEEGGGGRGATLVELTCNKYFTNILRTQLSFFWLKKKKWLLVDKSDYRAAHILRVFLLFVHGS